MMFEFISQLAVWLIVLGCLAVLRTQIVAMTGHEGAWLYVLSCRGGRLYCGVCLDLVARFEQHCLGKGAKFTKAFAPEFLAAGWHFSADLGQVQKYEYAFKKISRSKKMRALAEPEQLSQILDRELAPFSLADLTAFKNPATKQ